MTPDELFTVWWGAIGERVCGESMTIAEAAFKAALDINSNYREQFNRLKGILETESAARKDAERTIERLTLQCETYQRALVIARPAISRSHYGHWDLTRGSGRGCPECIRARKAIQNIEMELKRGIDAVAAAAARKKPE